MQEACLSKGSEQRRHTSECERKWKCFALNRRTPFGCQRTLLMGIRVFKFDYYSVSCKHHGGDDGWFLST